MMRADRPAPGTAGRLTDRVGRNWQAIAAIAIPIVLVGLTIGPALIGRSTFLSVTLLTGHMPWQAFYGFDAHGHQYCNTDTIDAVLPDTAYVRNQVFAGHLANWQPLISGGSPLASTPNLALLSPVSLPYWIMPIWLAPAFVKLAEFIVAIGGMYLFLRRLGRDRLASSTAGVIFATSGFMVMWTNWPQTRTAAWIPALFWAAERLMQRRRPGDVAIVGLVVASMLLAGFPAVTGYALYLVGAYVIVRVIALYRRNIRTILSIIALAVAGLVLGVLLAAIQLVPFALRIGDSDLSRRAQSSGAHLPFSGLFTTIIPNANGVCIDAQFKGHVNPVELIAYIGAAAVALAVITASLVWWRRGNGRDRGVATFFVVAVVVIVLLGWFHSPALRLAQHFPVFSNNFVGRIRSVFGFAMAVLAAFAIDWMLAGRRARAARAAGTDDEGPAPEPDPAPAPEPDGAAQPIRQARTAVAVLWFLAVWTIVVIIWLKLASTFGKTSMLATWRLLRLHPLTLPMLAIGLTLVAAVVAWFGNRAMRGTAALLVAVLVLVQGVAFFRVVQPSNTLEDFYPVTPAHRFLSAHDGHDRFDSSGGTLYPATAPYYGLRVATGHAFLEREWSDLLRAVDPKSRMSPTNYGFSQAVTPENVGNSPILDRMGIKYFAFDPTLLPGAATELPEGDGSAQIPANGSLQCSVPAGPIRGIQIRAQDTVGASSPDGITLSLTVHAGQQVLTGARYLGGQLAARGIVTVPVAGEDVAAGTPVSVDIRAKGAAGPVSLVTSGGQPICEPVRPQRDQLKLVHADAGTIIFQRLTALPRIRWAGKSVVIPDATARVAALKSGVPRDTVVLNAPAGSGSGAAAKVAVTNDSGDRLTADVDAAGAGYLVVADAMNLGGWSATVDGKHEPLLHADHAMVAVPVPGGQHTVRLSYSAPGQRVGAALTGLGVLVLVGLLVAERRWRRTPAPVLASAPEPVPAAGGRSS